MYLRPFYPEHSIKMFLLTGRRAYTYFGILTKTIAYIVTNNTEPELASLAHNFSHYFVEVHPNMILISIVPLLCFLDLVCHPLEFWGVSVNVLGFGLRVQIGVLKVVESE